MKNLPTIACAALSAVLVLLPATLPAQQDSTTPSPMCAWIEPYVRDVMEDFLQGNLDTMPLQKTDATHADSVRNALARFINYSLTEGTKNESDFLAATPDSATRASSSTAIATGQLDSAKASMKKALATTTAGNRFDRAIDMLWALLAVMPDSARADFAASMVTGKSFTCSVTGDSDTP